MALDVLYPAMPQPDLERRGDVISAPFARHHQPSARVALVHLGNVGGLGTTRRVGIWHELLAAADMDVVEINLLAQHRRGVPAPSALLRVAQGSVVPETATWSARSAAAAMADVDPDVTLFVTPRAFHPRLAAVARFNILDFQDRFSRSYLGRAAADHRVGASAAWRTLGWVTSWFEARNHHVRTVTAGWAEAREIGATWIPNTAETDQSLAVTDHAYAPADVLFFGKLTALPNLDALRRLARMWPSLVHNVPGATCLIAGADVNEEVLSLADAHGWKLEEDFDSVQHLCKSARVAVAPLRYANGIQNKVLEAAACGIPQVVSSAALRGTAPGFPAIVADDDQTTVAAVTRLLEDPALRVAQAREAHAHVAELYSVDRWAPRVHELVMW